MEKHLQKYKSSSIILAFSCTSKFNWFSVWDFRSVHFLPSPTWWWPSLCPLVASWPTTCAARTSWQLPLSGKSWTAEVRSLNRGWNQKFPHLSLHGCRVLFWWCQIHSVVFKVLLTASWAAEMVLFIFFGKNLSAQYFSTRVDSLIVTVHWFHIWHLCNWVQIMYHA